MSSWPDTAVIGTRSPGEVSASLSIGLSASLGISSAHPVDERTQTVVNLAPSVDVPLAFDLLFVPLFVFVIVARAPTNPVRLCGIAQY